MYYSDKPITLKDDDQLGRNGFAALLAQSLLNLNTQDTFTVGLFGKWGSGKTSIVNMMLNEIEEQQNGCPEGERLIAVHFEPWNFSSTDQLLSQFFIRLSNEFRSTGDKRLAKIGEALETYSDAFDLLSAVPVAGGLMSFLGKKGAATVGGKLKKGSGEKDISKQKEFVIKLLQEQTNRILVVIDDIDRLSNEQIRQVFQLVTSAAKFPNTIYLLVFDKDIVVKALEKVQEGSGKDYLEKIIQMPIQIPDIKPAKLRQLLLDRLQIILSQYRGVGFQKNHWQKLYDPCIASFVDSLRTINRLCNTVQFKLSSISTEVDFADIAAISILEIQHPEVYEWVKDHKAFLTEEPAFPIIGEGNKTEEDRKSFYSAQIQALLQNSSYPNAVEKRAEEIISFLSYLFPCFGRKIGKKCEGYNIDVLRMGNRIAHPEKFDRYFSLDMDDIAIKKSEIMKAAYESDCESLVKTLLKQEENGTSCEFLEEMRVLYPDFPADRAEIIIAALVTASPHLTANSQKNFLRSTASAEAMLLAMDLLIKIDSSVRFQFISDILSNADLFTLQSIAEIIVMIESAYGRLDVNGETGDFWKVLTLDELIKIELIFVDKVKEAFHEHSLFDFFSWPVVCGLMECVAPKYMKTYLKSELKSDSKIAKYLTASVAIWTLLRTEYQVKDSFKKYLTEERVLQAVKSLKQSGELFTMNEDIQRKCCAFYLYTSYKAKKPRDDNDNIISEFAVNNLLSKWTRDR